MTGAGDERARVLALLQRWGWNATGFQVLERGFRHFFDGDDACVSYVDTGRAWVVAGAPIAPEERLAEVAARFRAAARQARRRVSWFAVERRFVELAGLPAIPIGEQATWDPRRWEATLAQRRSLREQLRRARAKGVGVRRVETAEVVDAAGPFRRAVEGLIDRWLATRAMPAMGFLVDVQPWEFAAQRRYFAAECGGRVVGFLCAVPVFARHGWLLEDLLRDPEAPNGTTELLIDTAMRLAAGEGSAYVTLGLAPLAGSVSPWLARIRRWTKPLYNFEGLLAFKAKLAPAAWDAMLLAYSPESSGVRAILDALSAFARGTLLGFGLRALVRGPAVVVRGLAILLVPWTIALALASPAWFPTAAVQYGWVAFNTVLAAALLALSYRWRQWLAVTLAVAVTGDALVTALEAALYNVPRVESAGTAAALAVACAGPTLGAMALWGAVRRLVRRASSRGG